MSALFSANLFSLVWRFAVLCLTAVALMAVSGCQADSVTPETVQETSVHETAASIEYPEALPPDALAIAQKYQVPAMFFNNVPDEVLARIDVDESQVRSYTDFASDRERSDVESQWVAECYTRAGWPSEVYPPGSGQVSYEGPNAPEMHKDPDILLCDIEAMLLFPFRPAPVTREEWQVSLDVQVGIAACLEAEGHDMPDPPTLDSFIDGGGMWSAYGFLPQTEMDEWNRLIVVCPQQGL